MRIWFYPLDTQGCGHYRMVWPMYGVERLGLPDMDLQLISPAQRTVAIEFDTNGDVAREHFPAQAGDVIVFQRATSKFQPQAIDRLQARGVACVIDMDDDLGSIHPRNIAHWQMRPRVPKRDPAGRLLIDPATGKPETSENVHSWHNVIEACRRAALVTVTTPQLARVYGSHGRVEIVPNTVPATYLEIDHPDSADIGWAGVLPTHPDDLQRVGPAIARLVRDGATFRTVGDPRGVDKVLGLDRPPPSTGPVPIERYAASIAQFGIGIAPLADTRFNRAKSWLKPLEYAAVGVPWVASPLPDYLKLHHHGCGMIADRPKAWEGCLRRLTRNPGLRGEMSAAGREVAAHLTIEATAWRWADAWRRAITELDQLGAVAPKPASTWRLPGLPA